METILLVLVAALAGGIVLVAAMSRKLFGRLRRRLDRLERVFQMERSHTQRLTRHVLIPEMRAAGQVSGRRCFEPELVSQHGEDAFLWELFEGKHDGYFVEVGAYDGYWMSATYALEAAGWTGLLVEPLPDRYEQCRARRPGSRVVHAAVSKRGSTGTAVFQAIVGGAKAGADMASGLDPQREQKRVMEQFRAHMRPVTVPLTTLADLLKEHSGRVDVALIDVEGAEMDVLDGLEVERTRPRVLVVEDLSLGGDRGVPDFLGARGYEEVARLGHNRFYARVDEPNLVRRARALAGPVAVAAPGESPQPQDFPV